MPNEKEKYFKNYKLEIIPDNSRKGYKRIYKYTGDYYSFDISATDMKKYKFLFLFWEIASTLVFMFTALQKSPINTNRFCIVPALITICLWIFEYVAVGFFCFVKFPLKEEDYKRINSTFYITFICRFLLLLISSVVSFILTIDFSLGVNGILISLGYLLCSIIALFLKIKYKHLNFKLKISSN